MGEGEKRKTDKGTRRDEKGKENGERTWKERGRGNMGRYGETRGTERERKMERRSVKSKEEREMERRSGEGGERWKMT